MPLYSLLVFGLFYKTNLGKHLWELNKTASKLPRYSLRFALGVMGLIWFPMALVATAILLLYVFARILIIVECFLDVFHLPDSAFEVPRWSQYFLHVG